MDDQQSFEFTSKVDAWKSRGSDEPVSASPAAEPSPAEVAAAPPAGARPRPNTPKPLGPKPYSVRGASWNFQPGAQNNFRLSRSKLDLFTECPRCFYLDNRLGIKRTGMPSFNLNTAVDTLLKREFDRHREAGTKHPIMIEHGIEAVPFQHAKIDVWRENFKGAEYFYDDLQLKVTAVPDDIWITPADELIIVDYKSTATNKEIDFDNDFWKQGYKRQMEVYQDVFRKMAFTVSDTGYFVYANASDREANFDGRLVFELTLHRHDGNASWVEPAVRDAHACLSSDELPPVGKFCEHCRYRQFAAKAEGWQPPA